MSQETLFDAGEPDTTAEAAQPEGEVRLKRANRDQALMSACVIDELIPIDHRARAFWHLLEKYDLAAFTAKNRARGSHPGRPRIDPRVLICLWLYATSEGVGSARKLAQLIERDAPYRWIAGGMTVGHHTLSDFRVEHEEALNQLLTDQLALLMSSGVVRLSRIAQDGTRVRAKAGASSFRRERSLKKCLQGARKQVKATRAQLDAPLKGDETRRQRAAAARAATDREARIERALAELEELRGGSQKNKNPEEVRASTTDPDARVMKHGDGGYRPSYNVQGAVDVESRVVVDVAVTKKGNDYDEIQPMLDRVEERFGRLPDEALVDGGYAKKEDIAKAEMRGVAIYAPQSKQRTGDPAKLRRGDPEGVEHWRRRMATPEAAEIYKQRAASIETGFGDFKQHRGLRQMPVTGIDKVLSIALWTALAYNFMREISLTTLY
jgi:transposase